MEVEKRVDYENCDCIQSMLNSTLAKETKHLKEQKAGSPRHHQME